MVLVVWRNLFSLPLYCAITNSLLLFHRCGSYWRIPCQGEHKPDSIPVLCLSGNRNYPSEAQKSHAVWSCSLLSSCASAGPLRACALAHLDGVMKASLLGELLEGFPFQFHASVQKGVVWLGNIACLYYQFKQCLIHLPNDGSSAAPLGTQHH